MLRLLLACLLSSFISAHAQTTLYYPPLTGNTWASTDPLSLGWCPDKIDSLYHFLQTKHTKAFIVLKDGRIVLEKYFGSFTADSFHYWASAGKTLTAFTTGIAQQEGLLHISQPSSNYLGVGWTSESPAKEALITIRHQLTMSSGLDDKVPNEDCTLPSCLQYKADAGTRWAYHNAPYTLVQRVVDSAAGTLSWQQYFNTRVTQKTGIIGLWASTNTYNSVFFSKPRAAARFGLLMLGRGIWAGDTILGDTAFLNAMTRPSQPHNAAYGYLTWLNSQTTYMLPGTQIVFNGPMVPAAPADLYAALGKDDQKIHVVPSQRLVVVRMGDAADSSQMAPTAFDNQLWIKLNAAMCNNTTSVTIPAAIEQTEWILYPQPARGTLHVEGIEKGLRELQLHDLSGHLLQTVIVSNGRALVQTDRLEPGHYVLSNGTKGRLFLKQ